MLPPSSFRRLCRGRLGKGFICFPLGVEFHLWTLGFKQSSLHHIGQPLTRSLGYQLRLTGPFLTCYGHVSVSLRAKSGGLLVFQQLSSDYFVVYSQRRFTAQHLARPNRNTDRPLRILPRPPTQSASPDQVALTSALLRVQLQAVWACNSDLHKH